MEAPLIRVKNLTKIYRSGNSDLVIFRELELEVYAGEQIAIVGASGAGKSTLLHLISGLDQPTSGSIWIGEKEITQLPEAARAGFRNQEIGYVWQQHHLLPEFTALENAALPLLIRGASQAAARKEALGLLEATGLAGRSHHRSGELSGGEQQRVAIARALVGKPRVLLADEPSGNLDESTGAAIFELLGSLRRSLGLTILLVTHNLAFARQSDRTLTLESGILR